MTSDRSLLKTILKIGLPIALQNFVLTSLNLVDNIMIGSRGEVSLAAVSLSNRIYFILIISIFGISSGLGMFTSQYFGAKDTGNIKKTVGIGLTLAFALSFTVAALTFFFPQQILSVFSKDALLLQKGSEYLKIVSFSYVPMALGYIFVYNSRSVHLTKLPMISSIIALSLNTILNYILINGKLGFPVLDVKGAAIATLISRLIETILLLTLIFRTKDHPLKGTLKQYFSYTFEMFRRVMKKAIPVIVNEASWSIGMSVYFIAYGVMGAKAVASIQVALTVSDLFWAGLIGFCNAVAVIIGNHLGARQLTMAERIARKSMWFTLIGSAVLGLIYFMTGKFIASIFNFEAETIKSSINVITVNAAYMVVKGLNFMIIVGILRSGGDAKFCMLTEGLTIFVIGIPLAFLSVYVFKLPVYLCVAVVYFEEVIKLAIVYSRYRSKKWLNVLI